MSIPSTYSTGFARTEITGKTDVQDAVDTVNTVLTSTLATADRWTSLGSGKYKAPVDEYGRTMYVVITKISATRLQFHSKDQNDVTIFDGRIDFATSYACRVWAGPKHLVVEFEYGASVFETAGMAMTDPLPFDPTSVGIYVLGWARRNSSGTAVGSAYFDEGVCNDGSVGSGMTIGRIGGLYSGNTVPLETESGAYVTIPAEVAVNVNSIWRASGRMYQCALVSPNQAVKSTVVLPLDAGVTGTFEVIGKGGSPSASYTGRMALRKA